MRDKGELTMGIGHRVKSINNPDQHVEIVKEFVIANFPATPLLHYALEVEKITTTKKPYIIPNVDGVIACYSVDMLKNWRQLHQRRSSRIYKYWRYQFIVCFG
ncbi:hypothetical protein JTB14_019852 [Gonioctena quinquepunctata]|nr:hypothetical protein JTB14_019852 [Gonioctena quinquepunctata]